MKTAKIFQNGQSQAVRIPREFRLDGKEVYIKRAGNAVVLIPVKKSWDVLTSSLDMFSADFMDNRDQPAVQHRREDMFR